MNILKYKKSFGIFGILLVILSAFIFTGAGKSVDGSHVNAVKIFGETNANSEGDTIVFSELKNYKKITAITGSTDNDSASYDFELQLGTGGMWKSVWADTVLSCITAKSGIIGTAATSPAQEFSYDLNGTSNSLYTEAKWIRRNKSSGNGTTIKTRANDWIILQKVN